MLTALDLTRTIAVIVITLGVIGGGCLVHGAMQIHAFTRTGEITTDARWFIGLIALALAADCVVAAVAMIVLMLPRLS